MPAQVRTVCSNQGSANGTRVLRKGRLTEVACQRSRGHGDPAGAMNCTSATAIVKVVKYLGTPDRPRSGPFRQSRLTGVSRHMISADQS
jgi:hypothetical protein